MLELESLKEKLSNYDLKDLLKKNAAYQLLPQNANKINRFEAVANAICANKYYKNKPKIAKSNLRQIYNHQLNSFRIHEDPFDQMFTESVSFYNDAYVVFPGITESGAFILKNLLNSIFLTEKPLGYNQFYEEAYQTSLLLLTMSNEVAKKAGFTYGVKSDVKRSDVIFPSASYEAQLIDAVTFKWSEIKEILLKNEISDRILHGFLLNLGDVELKDYTIDNHILHLYPLASIDDEIIVILPCNLIATLRHALIVLAIKYNFIDHLKTKFEQSLWRVVHECTDIMGMTYIKDGLPHREEAADFLEGLFKIDSDKFLYVQLHTDDFSGYNPDKVFDNGFIVDNEQVERRIKDVKDYIAHNNNNFDQESFFVILLLQTAGRNCFLGLTESIGNMHLMMSVHDMQIISYLVGKDPLHLYKYCKALRKIRPFYANFLDPYSLYRLNGNSFYFSDNEQPNVFFFSVGDGKEVIEEMYEKMSPHGVFLPQKRGIIEVVSLYGDKKIPIFTPIYYLGRKAALYVEGRSWGIWVSSPVCNVVTVHFVDMVAYWIWQFSDFIKLKEGMIIEIEINLYPLEQWCSPGSFRTITDSSTANEIEVYIEGLRLVVNISYEFSKKLLDPTNRGERLLIREILKAILQISDSEWTKERLDTEINKIAPLGPKKKLIVLNDDYTAFMNEGTFPKVRYVDSADENEILDEIGHMLTHQKGLKVGRVENPVQLLQEVVAYLFAEIQKTISSINNADDLIEKLLLYYEALLNEKEKHRLTMTTAMHCFSNEAGMIEKLKHDLNKFNKLSLSLRFIIEYVSACPPTKGTRQFSLEKYDRLIALSAQLIQWANTSDLIHFKLAEYKLSILPSKRLGIGNREGYESATSKYLNEYSIEFLSSAFSYYENRWNENNEKETNEDFYKDDHEFHNAFLKEFNVDFKSFLTFIGSVIEIGRTIANPVKSYLLTDLKERLFLENKLDRRVIDHIFGMLSLTRRENFLNPPNGFRKEDVYPWRFNREISYLRKPFILWDDKIYWTNRHLYYSAYHLINLCRTGKLKAKSNEMKKVMGRYLNQHGERFNKSIAKLFSEYEHLIVDTQVRKIGRHKIQGEQGDLGDIDVLVIDPSRKKIFTIECKDLSVARNPFETYHEINELIYGTKGNASIKEKHLRRTAWIQRNYNHVLAHYNVGNPKGKWEVIPMIVLDEAMLSPYLVKEKGIKIISYNQLKRELESGKFFKR